MELFLSLVSTSQAKISGVYYLLGTQLRPSYMLERHVGDLYKKQVFMSIKKSNVHCITAGRYKCVSTTFIVHLFITIYSPPFPRMGSGRGTRGTDKQ